MRGSGAVTLRVRAPCAWVLAMVAIGPAVVTARSGENATEVPRVILVWGDTLPRPVILTKPAENAIVLASLAEAWDIDVSRLPGRPAYDVAFFMDSSRLARIVADTATLAHLDPAHADQRGRLYPPVDGLESVFVFETTPPDGGHRVRRVGVPGLTVLRRYGLALRSVE